MINAVLVDDHELFRMGIKAAINARHSDIHIVAEAETGEEFFRLFNTLSEVDIVLLDICLPGMSGIDIARHLRKEHPNVKILVISSENTETVARALLDLSIDGFISKRMSNVVVLVDAIHSIMNGLEYFGEDISEIIYRIFSAKREAKDDYTKFSPQERKIIELCRDGLQSKEIAARLFLSPRTIENHKNNIFKKLGINNTVELITYAIKHGIINVDN
jgi:DNA-binding NarL/FixJ family response regulator